MLKKESNIGAIIFTILIISLFVAGIYYFLKTKKAKNKIIHQLLGDEETNGKIEDIKAPKIRIENHSEKKEREKKERRRKEFKREILRKYKK